MKRILLLFLILIVPAFAAKSKDANVTATLTNSYGTVSVTFGLRLSAKVENGVESTTVTVLEITSVSRTTSGPSPNLAWRSPLENNDWKKTTPVLSAVGHKAEITGYNGTYAPIWVKAWTWNGSPEVESAPVLLQLSPTDDEYKVTVALRNDRDVPVKYQLRQGDTVLGEITLQPGQAVIQSFTTTNGTPNVEAFENISGIVKDGDTWAAVDGAVTTRQVGPAITPTPASNPQPAPTPIPQAPDVPKNVKPNAPDRIRPVWVGGGGGGGDPPAEGEFKGVTPELYRVSPPGLNAATRAGVKRHHP